MCLIDYNHSQKQNTCVPFILLYQSIWWYCGLSGFPYMWYWTDSLSGHDCTRLNVFTINAMFSLCSFSFLCTHLLSTLYILPATRCSRVASLRWLGRADTNKAFSTNQSSVHALSHAVHSASSCPAHKSSLLPLFTAKWIGRSTCMDYR